MIDINCIFFKLKLRVRVSRKIEEFFCYGEYNFVVFWSLNVIC